MRAGPITTEAVLEVILGLFSNRVFKNTAFYLRYAISTRAKSGNSETKLEVVGCQTWVPRHYKRVKILKMVTMANNKS